MYILSIQGVIMVTDIAKMYKIHNHKVYAFCGGIYVFYGTYFFLSLDIHCSYFAGSYFTGSYFTCSYFTGSYFIGNILLTAFLLAAILLAIILLAVFYRQLFYWQLFDWQLFYYQLFIFRPINSFKQKSSRIV